LCPSPLDRLLVEDFSAAKLFIFRFELSHLLFETTNRAALLVYLVLTLQEGLKVVFIAEELIQALCFFCELALLHLQFVR